MAVTQPKNCSFLYYKTTIQLAMAWCLSTHSIMRFAVMGKRMLRLCKIIDSEHPVAILSAGLIEKGKSIFGSFLGFTCM